MIVWVATAMHTSPASFAVLLQPHSGTISVLPISVARLVLNVGGGAYFAHGVGFSVSVHIGDIIPDVCVKIDVWSWNLAVNTDAAHVLQLAKRLRVFCPRKRRWHQTPSPSR